MTARPKLLIRADAGTAMGTGHVMRCLALAQAWQDSGGSALFVSALERNLLADRLRREGFDLVEPTAKAGSRADAQATARLAGERDTQLVVLDGYNFGASFQQDVRASGVPLLVIDDYGHAAHYSADLVLNQNLDASAALYKAREPHTALLLGTRYALLRREFWPWRGWRREVAPRARHLLITLGGGDPDNISGRAVLALADPGLEDLDAVVAVGAGNPHLDELRGLCAAAPGRVRLEHDVADMPALMRWADLAICAGGTTCWELCFLGLPSLTVVIADNQRRITAGLDEAGIAITMGDHRSCSVSDLTGALGALACSQERREQMARRGQELVDGRGGERVVARAMALRAG